MKRLLFLALLGVTGPAAAQSAAALAKVDAADMSIAAARANAAAFPIATITPWIADHDGEPHLFIPEGLGYPVTREPLASVRRGVGEGIFPAA